MYILWKLVLLAVISTGPSAGSDLENIEDLNKEEDRLRSFLSNSDIIIESKFQCQNKPSGYYADPRYDCKVFHFCHEDGTKLTIPCTSETEEHQICMFRDIAFNACEGSEIYLALPEDLQVKTSKETTASAINSATDFKLPNVLPQPSSPENNHSTTPLSLDFAQKVKSSSGLQTKESDSIFEVINSVLREIQADNNEFPVKSQVLKLRPSTFSRGSKFQASSIRRDDSSDTLLSSNSTDDEGSYLVEVYPKNNGKSLSDPNHKRSKRLFFLTKSENQTPAVYPRRKKRTVVEPINVSRPYAVIYAKVPDVTKARASNVVRKDNTQRKDIIEVPFVAARVPADVPTVPVTIETRRKKKSKSKKKAKNIPQTVVLQETAPQEPGNEQAAEQQNILYYTPGETPNVGLQNGQSRPNNRQRAQRPQQNREQPQHTRTQLSSNAENPQNNLQPGYQQSLWEQSVNPLQIPNFPFQPTAFLGNPPSPPYNFESQDLHQTRGYPGFNLQDQFIFQPQQPRIPQSNSFQQPDPVQAQSLRQNNKPRTESRQPENSQSQRFRQNQNIQPQNVRQQENHSSQSARHPNVTPQNIRQPSSPYSQPEITYTFRQPNNVPQTLRQPENVRLQVPRQQEFSQPFREPGNAQTQTIRQPENTYTQTTRLPESTPSQAFRNSENIQPQSIRHPGSIHTIRQPEAIQPQTIGQLQNIYLQNVPTFSLGQPDSALQQAVRRPGEQELGQNAPTNDQEKNNRGQQGTQEQNVPSQRFPSFDSSFFQNFPNFGPLNFNSPFTQPLPQTYDLISPNAVRYQEQLNPSLHSNNEEKAREQIPQQVERPQDQVVPLILADRPQSSLPQNYGDHGRQQIPETHNTAINQPGPNAIYLHQPNQNPNLIEAERVKQERPTPSAGPQILIAIPERPRSSRNRVRTTVAVESPTRQPTRQRTRNQSTQNQNPRRPQENRLYDRPTQEPRQISNYNRRPTEPPHPTSEVVYHTHNTPEVSVGDVPNDIRYRTPSTVAIPDFRLQESPDIKNIRDGHRETVYSQRQPTSYRNRHQQDSINVQSPPQYSTYQYTSTTPVPVQRHRQRTRRPEQYPSRQTYQQNPREANKESVSDYHYGASPPPYERTRTRTSTTPEHTTERLPVTNRYFVTSAPRFRQTEEPTNRRRPQHYSESRPDRPRGRPQAQIERPPQEYGNTEPVAEEYPRPQRYSSQRRPSSNTDNDVNTISTAEDPGIRHRPPPSATERRPGYRGTTSDRQRYNPEIEHGFHPVSERPSREPSYAPRAPGRDYSDTPRAPARDYSDTQRAPERQYSYSTSAPVREYATRVPEREYSYATRAPEREYSYSTRAPEREYSFATRAPEREYSYATRAPEREYSYATRAPERDYTPRAPERDYSYTTRAPERDYSYTTRAPEREYSYATRAPERDYREPVNERTRGNRYQSHDEEPPTTQPTTTTPRPTKKRKPPPPRPTFPPFPTFPPPPRRLTPPPRPKTEDPEPEIQEVTEHVTEYPTTTTQQSIRRQKPKTEVLSEISEPRYVTENYIQTDAPEVTTRKRSRKRRPRPRRPKTTTISYSEDDDAIQVESITQATTHKEATTRSTASNYNRWRQQTSSIRKSTTTTTTSAPKSATESEAKADEYGSRLNLFGRPRTRKPAVYTPRPTTTEAPVNFNERKRITKIPTAARSRKPFVKKVRKRITTTTAAPETTEPLARSDEDEGILHYNSDVNLQELESNTQVAVENMEYYQTTEAYNDAAETTAETSTVIYEEELSSEPKDKSENFESTRSVSNKFQNRPRILKFGKPRLKPTDPTIV